MPTEREYWKLYYENQELEKKNSELDDKLKATNEFIKQFLDLVRDNKIQLTIPEFGIDLSTDCGPYDSDEELLREILDVYNHAVKHKEMYDSERSES